MKAIDTNILVRWITRDDPVQSPVADRILSDPVFVSLTVLVELAWTLGGKPYRLGRAEVAAALKLVLNTRTITIQREDGVGWAIDRFAAGADIADMLHLVASSGVNCFISFEKRLIVLAGPDTPIPIERAA